jgi:hypothetical protein
MTDTGRMHTRSPAWLLAVAALGVAWNAFGIVQLVDFVTQTYYGLPAWMKLVFAVGSVGGLVGSIALVTRRLPAVPILLASLAGYVALWAGDLAHGVFDVIPGQMAVLSAVVAVAVALLGTALLARRQGIVR